MWENKDKRVIRVDNPGKILRKKVWGWDEKSDLPTKGTKFRRCDKLHRKQCGIHSLSCVIKAAFCLFYYLEGDIIMIENL